MTFWLAAYSLKQPRYSVEPFKTDVEPNSYHASLHAGQADGIPLRQVCDYTSHIQGSRNCWKHSNLKGKLGPEEHTCATLHTQRVGQLYFKPHIRCQDNTLIWATAALYSYDIHCGVRSSSCDTRRHLTSIRTKHRNRLNLEPALILALTKIRPRIEVLACQK
jgi:hypothetical protein